MGILIIAEAGVNHNGSLALAKQMVVAAKKCGADIIKFQAFRADRLVSAQAPKADYQKKNTRTDESQRKMLKKYELNVMGQDVLKKTSDKLGIEYLASPFDEASADELASIGLARFKIPSGEITNHPFLAHVSRKQKPIILSTGMSTLKEVERALNVIFREGNRRVTLLHCVTEYPAPFTEINLRAMETMKKAFGLPVGYSDHTLGIEISVAAAALGAEIIEKHFTLDRNMKGPDHRSSLEPKELAVMIQSIRHVESALGTGVKEPAPCEIKNLIIVRKSLVAARPIRRGEVFRLDHLVAKRAGKGISPDRLDELIGRKAPRNYRRDEVIEL